jgi:outer membrane murein-binding lipoprotein Lpp
LEIASKPDHITPEKRAVLDAAITAYKTKHPNLISAGMIRLEDLAAYSGTASAVFDAAEPDMMSPISNAATELEQTRLLGAHVVWLASRLPTAAGWEAQATIDMAMSSPAVLDGLNRVQKLSEQLETTGRTVTSLSSNVSSLATDMQSLSTNVQELRQELGDLEGDRTLVREAIGAAAVISALLLLVLTVGFITIARAVRARQSTSQAPGARDSA